MSSPKTRKGSSINNIVDYTLPKLHTGKNWYIDFTGQRNNLRDFIFKHII